MALFVPQIRIDISSNGLQKANNNERFDFTYKVFVKADETFYYYLPDKSLDTFFLLLLKVFVAYFIISGIRITVSFSDFL